MDTKPDWAMDTEFTDNDDWRWAKVDNTNTYPAVGGETLDLQPMNNVGLGDTPSLTSASGATFMGDIGKMGLGSLPSMPSLSLPSMALSTSGDSASKGGWNINGGAFGDVNINSSGVEKSKWTTIIVVAGIAGYYLLTKK